MNNDSEFLRGAIGRIVFEATGATDWDRLSKEGRELYRSVADRIIGKLDAASFLSDRALRDEPDAADAGHANRSGR